MRSREAQAEPRADARAYKPMQEQGTIGPWMRRRATMEEDELRHNLVWSFLNYTRLACGHPRSTAPQPDGAAYWRGQAAGGRSREDAVQDETSDEAASEDWVRLRRNATSVYILATSQRGASTQPPTS